MWFLNKRCSIIQKQIIHSGYRVIGSTRFYSEILNRICDVSRSSKIAVVDPSGVSFTYQELNSIALNVLSKLSTVNGQNKIDFIASYCHPSSDYVVSMIAAWRLGASFVPLSPSHSKSEIKYFLENTNSKLIFASASLKDQIYDLGIPCIEINSFKDKSINSPCNIPQAMNSNDNSENGLVLFTSGTTGKPKGVVHTHKGLEYMIKSLVEAWEYTENDKILHFLPLHHLHGVLNKLLCVLWAGGTVEFLPSSSPQAIWSRLSNQSKSSNNTNNDNNNSIDAPITLFMAVPTVYMRLLQTVPTLTALQRAIALESIRKMRLMVSGSAALPAPLFTAWEELTSQKLLERFGMTEIGMALSNPYRGDRVMGEVGSPLPYVQCRLVDDSETEIVDLTGPVTGEGGLGYENNGDSLPGEIRIKGPAVFSQYLGLPEVTKSSFDAQGWFRTGDTAVRTSRGTYQILGRTSVDIIKCGGFKLSALEIEREILSHPQVLEAAVVGRTDQELGEIPVAILILKQDITGIAFDLKTLNTFLSASLARYKQPRALHIVEHIPRNALGKVNKKSLLKDLQLS